MTENTQHFQSGAWALLARSQALREVMDLIKRIAPTSSNVLITGESGTGKELVARAIHECSRQRDGVFVPSNVAAIPEPLLESYMFGHRKGSFTGAIERRDGAFKAANKGTLFLDEVGELPLSMQAKLLRALEQKEVLPVGSDVPFEVNTRVVTATGRDLKQMVQAGFFRQDLYYRLNVINIHLPALRDRPEDIPDLVKYYITKYCQAMGKKELSISNDALQCLITNPWLGNIRELSHVLERAVLLCDSDHLTKEQLPVEFCGQATRSPLNMHDAVEACKRKQIITVLEGVKGNRELAAKSLGISAATLFRYLDKYNLKGYQCSV